MSLKVIVCGAGEAGAHIASLLSAMKHSVSVVDTSPTLIAALADSLDISTLCGSCTNVSVLKEAGVADADLVVACTNQDEINLLTAAFAKALGARRVVARVEHRVFFESVGLDYFETLGIDGMICPDYSTARAISRILRNPGALAIEDFGQDELEMQEFVVDDDAPAIGISLEQLPLPAGTLVLAITHNGTAVVPDGSASVSAGDTIVLIGNTDVFHTARKQFRAESRKNREIVIMSGSPIAVWLCRALRNKYWSVRLFEPVRERAEELSIKLDWVTVIQEDVVSPAVFEEEKVGQADVFVACGEDDEQNILSCVWAKNNGTKTVVAVSGRSDYLGLLNQIGIDFAFSPRNEAAEEIENFLVGTPLRILSSMADGAIDIYRVPVGEDAPAAGQTIAQIGAQIDWKIAAVRREDRTFVPTAADSIAAGDLLIVVGRNNLERDLSHMFDSDA